MGSALAGAMQGSARRVFVLVSDAECNEGAIWEAASFAAQHRLRNLTLLVDHNHQQAFGYTSEILESNAMADRWRAFGWDVIEVDGHDELELAQILAAPAADRPRASSPRRCSAKASPTWRRELKWHYLPMSDEEYEQAMREIGARA